MKCVEKAFAKINLWLDVIGKRSDGYHDIESIMQSVSLHDTVIVETSCLDVPELFINDHVSSSSCLGKLPAEKNLCIKAARIFFEALRDQKSIKTEEQKLLLKGSVKITLEKNIPAAAGLGGGSADAAATLRALNKLFLYPFTKEELCTLASKLGADVPFCVCNGTYSAEGIGEKLTKIDDIPDCFIVIAYIEGKSSTADAYSKLDAESDYSKHDFDKFKSTLKSGDITKLSCMIYNRFESLYPYQLNEAKTILKESGALNQMMSGSGLSVFGIFENEALANKAACLLRSKGYISFVTCPAREIDSI